MTKFICVASPNRIYLSLEAVMLDNPQVINYPRDCYDNHWDVGTGLALVT